MNFTLATAPTICGDRLGNLIFEVGNNFAVFTGMVITSNSLHFVLKHYAQPRITSDIIVGLIAGNIRFVHKLVEKFNKSFGFIIDFGMMCYMFALGIEMDPFFLLERPRRQAKVAYAGVISTFLLSVIVTPLLMFFQGENKLLEFTFFLSSLVASTSSPVLTRLITHLKIGKSDIGKLVIAAGMHSDFLSALIFSFGYILVPLPQVCNDMEKDISLKETITMGGAVLGQVVFTALASPCFMKWVNNENPEGRAMKGPHVVLSIAFFVLMCASSTMYDYSPIFSAFLVGVCVPREGRVSKWLITKINYMLTTIFFPIFFLWVGYEANFSKFEVRSAETWLQLLAFMVVVVSGKVIGTIVSGAILGFHLPESVVTGLLLTTKGHLHIYLAIKVMSCGATTVSTGIVIIISIFFTIVPAPAIVAHIIKRARKRAPTHRLALQLLDPSTELRILLCVQGPQNVPASINFLEISKGASDAGVLVYVADMIELTDEISATLDKDERVHTATVKDKQIMDMRENITSSFQTYVVDSDSRITLKRTMALSTINNMPQDICVLAEDLMIALIVLPFHRSQHKEGTLDGGNQGFRYVNRKVLRSAPCSVGILVDRGLGTERVSRCQEALNVAVIFIGGKDDREALSYAGRISHHPGVKLTVIRFLVESSVEASRLAGYRIIIPEQEKETKLDNEFFAQFYENHVSGGHISYVEKHLANAAETFSILRSFEGKYSLVIVGREGGVNSILTKGMNDWQQCPELGPIGDVLSGPDFSLTVSVLIIQQHRVKGEIDGLDDDFSII